MPWNSVQCHPSVKSAVTRSIERGMFSQSSLIYGPPGAGQRQVALAVAMTLFCPQLPYDFCGECKTCKLIGEQKFSDLFQLHPEGVNYKIDQIRQLQELAVHYPYESDVKVFILYNAERMNKESANCLLKTLEEPYAHNRFLLVTENVSGILTTIISRCRRIRLCPQPVDDLVRHLSATLPGDQALTLARLAGGLPEQAQELIETGYLETRDEMLDLLESVLDKKSNVQNAVNALTKEKSKEKDLLKTRLTILLGFIRDGILSRQGGAQLPYVHADRSQKLAALWQKAYPDRLITCFEQTLDAIESQNRYLNMNIVLTELFYSINESKAEA